MVAMMDSSSAAASPLFSRSEWRRRAALWLGATLVAVAAIGFTKAADAAQALFRSVFAHSHWWALLITPGVFALLAWATNGRLKVTRGSGIPQAPLTSAVIAMELTDKHDMVLPIMATCLLARAFSAQLCHRPIYKALAAHLLATSPKPTI